LQGALAAATVCSAADKVSSLDVRLLSTMLTADEGYGEWGFAALVVADGHRILFDTGAHPDTVLRNARDLHIDLSNVPDVILSHHHLDHTAGLVTLRREYAKSNPAALARAHVGVGIFLSRTDGGAREANTMIATRRDYESAGGTFIEYNQPRELFPGVWLTGPVPRKYPEKNWNPGRMLRLADGNTTEDNLPEDQSLVIVTDRGLVVISGCGHSGIVNTLDYARAKIAPVPIYAALGGFHLYQASRRHLGLDRGKAEGIRPAKSAGRALHRHRSRLPLAPAHWPGSQDGRSGCGRWRIQSGHRTRSRVDCSIALLDSPMRKILYWIVAILAIALACTFIWLPGYVEQS
jgi:7,8-dihydropterin-6-yl-methyl-4-(beta-D-ribofuranosyl)aminobenzene 5'-phosphate synthase